MHARLLLAGAALLASAAPAGAEASVQDPARVARFLAALPPSGADAGGDTAPDFYEERVSGLIARQPARAEAIRATLATRRQCAAEVTERTTAGAMRHVASQMSDAELDGLTAFYSGPDYRALVASAAPDEALMAELMKRYPLQRFHEEMGKATGAIAEAAMNGFFACDEAADAALAAAGVKRD